MNHPLAAPAPAAARALGDQRRPGARRSRGRRGTRATRAVLGVLALTVAAAAGGVGVHMIGMVRAMSRPVPPTDVGTVKVSANGRYRVLLAPEIAPAPLHQLHRWTARVGRADGAGGRGAGGEAPLTVRVDGGMPQHGHGLPTQPRVTGRLPDGRLVIDGMKFSMPGWWELRLYLTGPAGADSVMYNLTL